MSVAPEGEELVSVVVPNGKIGLATVCSTGINGVLLSFGSFPGHRAWRQNCILSHIANQLEKLALK